MMKLRDLPPPETLIEYQDGSVGPLMFHYAVEGDSYDQIAVEQGFKVRSLHIDNDASNQDLADEYKAATERGDTGEDILARWNPQAPEGWLFGGKGDTEDGPIAWFLCREVDAAGAKP